MTLSVRISDAEADAMAPELAAAVLEHPLARRVDWQTIWPVIPVHAGIPGIRPARALRPALVVIDAPEIALGLEAR